MTLRTGKHISIEGMDGVGKSTICQLLAKRIGFEFIEKPLRFVFNTDGDFDEYIRIRDYVNAQEDRIFTSMFYGLSSAYLYSQYSDRNIITDRHFVSNYMWSGEKGNEPVYRMLIETLGVPDLTMILYADSDTIRKRLETRNKKDLDLKKVQFSEKLYSKIYEFFNKYEMPHIIIDTTNMSPEKICDYIEKELIKRGII